MEATIFDKILNVLKYTFSSFLGIELLLLAFLLFLFTVLNIKKNNKIVKIGSIILCLAFVVGLCIAYHSYAMYCVDSFIKFILSYIYFPSMVMYFFIMIIVTFSLIVTIVSNRMSRTKKVINAIVLSIQISNILVAFWLEYTVLYYFYRFLEYKLDKKSS